MEELKKKSGKGEDVEKTYMHACAYARTLKRHIKAQKTVSS